VSADGRISLIHRLKLSRNPLIAFRNHPASPLAQRHPWQEQAARSLEPAGDGWGSGRHPRINQLCLKSRRPFQIARLSRYDALSSWGCLLGAGFFGLSSWADKCAATVAGKGATMARAEPQPLR
jgi:hypothetical protein